MNNFKNENLNTEEDVSKASSSILRKCCACGKIADRNGFIRILRDFKTGDVILNPNNFQFGRSIYICKNSDCLKLASKKKKLKFLSETQLEELKDIIC